MSDAALEIIAEEMHRRREAEANAPQAAADDSNTPAWQSGMAPQQRAANNKRLNAEEDTRQAATNSAIFGSGQAKTPPSGGMKK